MGSLEFFDPQLCCLRKGFRKVCDRDAAGEGSVGRRGDESETAIFKEEEGCSRLMPTDEDRFPETLHHLFEVVLPKLTISFECTQKMSGSTLEIAPCDGVPEVAPERYVIDRREIRDAWQSSVERDETVCGVGREREV